MGTPQIPLRRSLAALALGAAFSLTLTAHADTAPTRDMSALSGAVAKQKALVAQARSAHPNGAGGEIFANPYRAYPPSCFNNGLPLGGYTASSAMNVAQANIVLFGDPAQCLQGGDTNECNYQETDTVTVWRVGCSGGKSATLVEIDRPSGHSTTLYPTVPLISATQGSKSLNVRFANDPNTFLATTYANQPLVDSDVFVLENFYGGSTQFNYNQAFSLFVNNFGGTTLQFDLPTYTAPASPPNLEISGYMSTNWSSQTQNGEGIVMQVYDNNDNATRTLAFAWFTYDKTGLPFWLFGQTSLPIGATLITAPTVYFQGGVFAPPTSTPGSAYKNWGFVTFTFPDCSHMNIAFNSTANPPSPVPTGQGSAVYTRVANVNGLACE